MQIFEVKNDIAKIIYNPDENHLLPSDFLLIEDTNSKIIAQILDIATSDTPSKNTASAKLILTIDKDENLGYFSGAIPSKESNILYINPEEILELIKGSEHNIYFGTLSSHEECKVKVPIDFIDDKLIIQSEKKDNTFVIINNIISELIKINKKIIILDFDGSYKSLTNAKHIKIGNDIKLPLNINAFNTIYDCDLNDCPLEDKTLIQSIILELREYLKTLEDNFLPFTMFKNVVEDELLQNPSSGLMLLRNKLWLYAQDGIFAEDKDSFEVLNNAIRENNIVIIDASALEEKWFSFILQTVTAIAKEQCYLFADFDYINADKKVINTVYNLNDIIPVFAASYSSNNIINLKSACNNRILFKPAEIEKTDEPFINLLKKLKENEYILYGQSTLYIPLTVGLELINANEETKNTNNSQTYEDNIIELEEDREEITESDLDFLDELNENGGIEINRENNEQYGLFNPENIDDIIDDILVDTEESTDNTPPSDNNSLEKRIESRPQTVDGIIDIDTDSLEDLTEAQDEIINQNIKEAENNELSEQTQAVINKENKEKEKEKENENNNKFEAEKEKEPTKQDNIIENTEKKEEAIKENNIIENTKKEELIKPDNINKNMAKKEPEQIRQIAPPQPEKAKEMPNINKNKNIPVYETDKPSGINPNEIPFKIGDTVYHPKHGKGIIEGFTNYSNKILFCQIEFENVGRRILDPMVAGLQKI